MKYIFLSFIVSLLSICSASTNIGKIVLFHGNVKIKKEDSIKKERAFLGFELQSGDMVVNAKNSQATIKLKDGSVLVLSEKSSVLFTSLKNVEQKTGKVLYKITSRDAKNSIKVHTPFAIIGIKGTTFIVSAQSDNAYISLKEGLLGISSLQEEFALYRKKITKEFEDYTKQQEREFKKFKEEYAEVKYTKEFDLHAGNNIVFDNNSVKEKVLQHDLKKEFAEFEQFIKDTE